MYTLIPFTEAHIAPAVTLWRESYRHEQAANPLLPARALMEPEWIAGALGKCLANPGVALLYQGQLAGYMVTGAQFPWKGQQAALVPEYGHGADVQYRRAAYQRMYTHLAEEWVMHGQQLHLLAHFAHDRRLQETYYQLGFGALLAERLRDLSPLDAVPTKRVLVVQERDVRKLVALELEHNRYYRQSPIFLYKDADPEATLADLEAQAQQGDAFFVHYEQGEPRAYMVVGESNQGGEGFLLQQTQTAQIKGAYARPALRGQGVGRALLQAAIQWAREEGYRRLFVEHETANVTGARFWGKHFAPYLYISMRYVDATLGG
jgi:GNAT superfamily N-acetyltransferase